MAGPPHRFPRKSSSSLAYAADSTLRRQTPYRGSSMSVPRLWPLLAFMFVPGVFAWWSGRRLVRERDDPTLAERFLARAEHAQRVTLLSAACLAFAAVAYYWFAVLGLVLGHWTGDYPSRRVVLDERWAPATYVLWHLRFHLAWLGFWFALPGAPTVIQAPGLWPC